MSAQEVVSQNEEYIFQSPLHGLRPCEQIHSMGQRCLRKNLKGGVMNTSAHPADLSQATAVSHIGSSRWGPSAPREERMLPQTWVPPSCLLSNDNKVSDLGFSRSVCLEHTALPISSTISLPTSDAPVKSARFLKGLHLQITLSDKVGSRKRVLEFKQ